MEYLLKASVVVAIFYSCYYLFLQRDTFFQSNRWFLLLGLLIAFCIPFIVIPIYIEQAYTPIQDFIYVNNDISSGTEESFNLTQIISVLYIIGVVFFLTRFIIQVYSLRRVLIYDKKKKSNRFTFIETSNDLPPFSFFKWIVYNPNQFSETELKQILTHEKVHAYQLHSIDILISQLATIILWFNPFMWLYKKTLQQNLEFIADNTAHHKANCKKSYQHLLLKTSLPNHQLALTNNFYNSLIKKRIVMLHKNKSKNRNLWKFTLILPLLALFLLSFNTKEVITYDNTLDATETITETLEPNGDMEMVLITKDFKDEDFKKIKDQFAKKGITLKFKSIKRNDKGEITAIKIDVKSKTSNSNYNVDSDEPINPIKISFDTEGNNISISNPSDGHFGKGNGYVYVSKDGNHKIHKTGKGNNTFVFRSDDEHEHDGENENEEDKNVFIIKKNGKIHEVKNVHKDKNVHLIKGDGDEIIEFISNGEDDGSVVWEDKDENVFKIKTVGKGNNKIFISGDSENKPIFILDGKEVSKEVIDELDSDNIEKMEVLKGDSTTKEYGDKGKNGVIIITTKTKE